MERTASRRMMHPAFVYPGVEKGLDLIEVVDRTRVVGSTNSWEAGQPLEDGTTIATFLVGGDAEGVLRARNDAPIGYATGRVGEARTTYTAMIDRVRDIVDKAAQLIDGP